MRMTIARGKHSRKSQSRKKLGSLVVMAMVIALALSTMAMASAGGPADKATGDGYWVNDWGSYYGEFNAHEAVGTEGERGYRAAKGDLFQDQGDGSFRVNVTGVIIGSDYACFWGPAYDSRGVFDDQERDDVNRWTYVTAGDGPGSGTFRGGWGVTPEACKSGDTAMVESFVFLGGNFTIHSDQAHQ